MKGGFFQQTGTCAGIEPLLDAVGEFLMVGACRFLRPRFGIVREESCLLGFELGERGPLPADAEVQSASPVCLPALLRVLSAPPSSAAGAGRSVRGADVAFDVTEFVHAVLLHPDTDEDVLEAIWALIARCRAVMALSAAQHINLWSRQ